MKELPTSAVVTRDSVCAADDFEAHETNVDLRNRTADALLLVNHLWVRANLPLIAGGNATWVLNSKGPIAVAAQQWNAPRLAIRPEDLMGRIRMEGGVARFHWAYRAQQAPETVFNELRAHCDRCEEVRAVVAIGSPADLQGALRVAADKLADGTLRCVSHIDEGLVPVRGAFAINPDGPWPDVLRYTCACADCGTEFELDAETYHGSGGHWRPVERAT